MQELASSQLVLGVPAPAGKLQLFKNKTVFLNFQINTVVFVLYNKNENKKAPASAGAFIIRLLLVNAYLTFFLTTPPSPVQLVTGARIIFYFLPSILLIFQWG